MIVSKFLCISNCLNEQLIKCFILGFCLVPISLFAGANKSKNNKYDRDTTVLRGSAYELAGVRFKKDSLFTPEQMREDVLFFYDKVFKTHPNPYHIISKDSLDKKIENILTSLYQPMNRREFWVKLATLNACFDVHTEILKIGEIYDYFWINSKPHISRNLSNNIIMSDSFGNLYFNHEYGDSLLAGKHIKSVNGIPTKEIANQISTYYSHENTNILPQRFASHFFLLFPHLFGSVDSFRFEYIKNDNEIDVRTFYPKDASKDTVPPIQAKQQINDRDIWAGKNFVRFNLYEEYSIAIIELNNFSPTNLGENFRKDLEAIMDTVVKKNIKHLFIDISANGGGGDHCAVEILNFVKTKKKKYYSANAETKISPAYREFIGRMHGENPPLSVKLSKYYRRVFKPDIGSIVNDNYYLTKDNSTIQYNQNVYLIQSTMATYSASTTLASLVKAYKFGIIIGEETGGLTSCYTNSLSFAMPNTAIPFMCATKRVTDVGGAMDGRGVLPDVEYKIGNPSKSFTLEQLKEMLQLVERYKGEVQ